MLIRAYERVELIVTMRRTWFFWLQGLHAGHCGVEDALLCLRVVQLQQLIERDKPQSLSALPQDVDERFIFSPFRSSLFVARLGGHKLGSRLGAYPGSASCLSKLCPLRRWVSHPDAVGDLGAQQNIGQAWDAQISSNYGRCVNLQLSASFHRETVL